MRPNRSISESVGLGLNFIQSDAAIANLEAKGIKESRPKKPKMHLNQLNDSIKINMLWKQKLNFDNLKKIKEDRAARRRGK